MKNDLNILYTCDNYYLEITSVSMASVIKNNEDRHINFYLATESSENEKYKHLVEFYKSNINVSIYYLDCRKYDELLKSKDFDKWGSESYYVYWRLFAPQLLNVDNIWYMDPDVLCLSKIIDPALAIDNVAGAVLDSAHACYNKVAHIDDDYYFFNTGTIYIDVNKWKEYNCEKRIIDYINKTVYKPLMCDQDIFSVALQKNIEVLKPEYCYFAGYDYYGVKNSFEMYSLYKKRFYSIDEVENGRKNTIFYHCLGGVFGRPWEEGNYSPIKDKYCYYRDLCAWPNFTKKRNISMLFRIEKLMEVLPKPIYNKLHNIAISLYTKNMGKN